MKIAGFNFNKINAEKYKNPLNELKINSNIDIADIKSVKSDFSKTKEELILVEFSYTLNYEPEIAKIEVIGNIILSLEPKTAKEVVKQWEDKKMPEDFRLNLFNIILRKASLRTLYLEEELNLPLHISMPVIKAENIKKQEE